MMRFISILILASMVAFGPKLESKLQPVQLTRHMVEPQVLAKNTPPEVTISVPKEGSSISWNSTIRYSIEVTDAEDGKSQYGEISSNDVLLEVNYFPDPDQARIYVEESIKMNRESRALALIKSTSCFTCHADKTRLVGPSWAEMAGRYSQDPSARGSMSDRITRGSTGAWGDTPMPPNASISPEDALEIADFILKQGGNKNSFIYSGLEGAFKSLAWPNTGSNGVYVLGATYTDQGVDGKTNTRKRGFHYLVLPASN